MTTPQVRFTGSLPIKLSNLKLTRLDNGWLLVVVDLSASTASSLESTDNTHGLLISDLAEDNVLAIEPSGDNGGNKELGAVAREHVSWYLRSGVEVQGLRVWSSVGHGQKSRSDVLLLKVLIGELLTVD